MQRRIMTKKPQRIGTEPELVRWVRPVTRPALFYLLELRSRVAANRTKEQTWRIKLEPADPEAEHSWKVPILRLKPASRPERRRNRQ